MRPKGWARVGSSHSGVAIRALATPTLFTVLHPFARATSTINGILLSPPSPARSLRGASPRSIPPKETMERTTFSSALLASIILIYIHWSMGQDTYPTYDTVPKGLAFTCQSRPPGYYADPEAQCQVWHWCLPTGAMYSFLCPNGTVFNQAVRVCDWWFNVDCATSPDRYSINDDLYKDAKGNYI